MEKYINKYIHTYTKPTISILGLLQVVGTVKYKITTCASANAIGVTIS